MTSRAGAPLRLFTWICVCIGAVIVGLIAHFARYGATSARIADPNIVGVPRPVPFLFGIDWLPIIQCGTAFAMLALTAICVVTWRRTPGHPNVLMTLASTAIVWQDPIWNWATYAAYNPQLWHWPEDWPFVNIAPTVQPFIVGAYALFFFGPYFPAVALLRRLQAKRSMDHFVWRRPLTSLAGLIFVIGFVIDAILEIGSVRTGTYIYTQTIPWGTLFAGSTFQFPLIWQSTLITIVMIPAGVLCYRDDTGRTVAEKLSQRLRALQTRPALATFLVMFGLMNVAYFTFGTALALIRATGIATSVACPWPFPEAKVYDPQGYYESAGHPGPYSAGTWSTWMSGQPDGRPKINALSEEPSCLPKEPL